MAIVNGQGRVGIRVTSGASSSPYLLNNYSGSSAAFSLRRLSSTSTYAIRVRRSSDNTEQNIGFDGSGNLDTTALTTFVGGGNGFVTIWYDQSGLGRDAIQTTASNQPKIVNSGTVLLSNSKPIIQTDGNSFLYNATIPINGTTNSIFFGLKITSSKSTCAMMSGGGDINHHFPMRTGVGSNRFYDSVSNITAAALPTGLNLINLHENSSGITVYENNTLLTSNYTHNTSNSTGLYLFRRESGNGLPADYGINEVIIYGSISKISDNSAISTNINNYYSIYTPLDTDASAFITAASITDSTQMSAVNTLVTSLKSNGLWSKMKAIYPVVGGNATAHSKNLKNPSQFNLAFSSGWVHSSTGMLPNGTSAFANTGFNGSNWQSTSNMSMGVYIRSNIFSGSMHVDMGAFGVPFSDNFISAYNSGNACSALNNSSNPYMSFTVTDSKGMYIVNRTSSTNTSLWKNGIKLGDGTNTAQTSALTTNLLIGAYADQATVKLYSPREIALAIMADTFTNGEISSLNSIITTFQTTLGRQV